MNHIVIIHNRKFYNNISYHDIKKKKPVKISSIIKVLLGMINIVNLY